jgi:hypothetical protein
MTDTTTDQPDAPPAESADEPPDGPDTESHPSGEPGAASALAGPDDVREYLLKGVLVVLALVGVVATFQFYTSAIAAINEWVAPGYRPVFRAAFNLVVVLLAGVGVSLVLRELSRPTGQ